MPLLVCPPAATPLLPGVGSASVVSEVQPNVSL
jgi:hypothetical protein